MNLQFQRRKPLQRVGYLLLEPLDRPRRLDLADGAMCPFPLQRQHLTDATGLSMIHLSRTLGPLRDEGLATIEEKMLIIFDRSRLPARAGYEALGVAVRACCSEDQATAARAGAGGR